MAMKQLHLRMKESRIALLDEFKELTDSSSRAEVLRESLFVYGWYIDRIREGARISAKNEDGETSEVEVITPGILAAKLEERRRK